MRVSDKELEQIKELSNRALGDGKAVSESDLRTAILHIRWLVTIEPERAASWHRFYGRCFKKIGITFPALGKDYRAVTGVKAAAIACKSPNIGRPSGRPSYCTHPLITCCGRCPERFGRFWDCTGLPVSGSWGVEVKNPASGEIVRVSKPADGKRFRGSCFQGGSVVVGGKVVKVPRGVSVGSVIAQARGGE